METGLKKTCAYCGLPPSQDASSGTEIKMKKCSRCKSVFYHDAECQKKHWKEGHKKVCGQSAGKKDNSKDKKTKHPSMDPVHQLVTRRFKELRSQGMSTQEAMMQARDELMPSEENEMDAGSKGTCMIYRTSFRCHIFLSLFFFRTECLTVSLFDYIR
jgi:hypothetical protein